MKLFIYKMNGNLTVVNNYGIVPIPLSMAKSFLRITSDEDNELIQMLLNSAINYAENKFGITIGKKDYEYSIYGNNADIPLPRSSIVQVNSVAVAGKEADFEFINNYVRIKKNHNHKPVIINFMCENNAFGEALTVAILRHVFCLYENRSVGDVETKDVESIYRPLFLNNYNI
jgi:hypothetical protein